MPKSVCEKVQWEFLTPRIVRIAYDHWRLFLSPDGAAENAPRFAAALREAGVKIKNNKFLDDGLCEENYGDLLIFCIPEQLLEFIPSVPAHWFGALMTEESKESFISYEHSAESYIKAISIFRKRAKEWVATNAREGRDTRASCFWLPILRRVEAVGLSDYLFRFRKSRVDFLRVVSAAWPRIAAEDRRLSPPKLFAKYAQIFLSEYKAEHSGLVQQAYLAQVTPGQYGALEQRWLASLVIPALFSAKFVQAKYRGKFLDRDDPRGLFLGALTNCCQYPGSEAESAAWHGQESPDGGFFVVEDAQGRVKAQSWVWRLGKTVCIDSVESLGFKSYREYMVSPELENVLGFDSATIAGILKPVELDPQLETVQELYAQLVRWLWAQGFEVRCGDTSLTRFALTFNGRLGAPGILVAGKECVEPPQGVYTDAKRQYILTPWKVSS